MERGRLGTFAGVFTPSVLTILGIILFLRLGYVTGARAQHDWITASFGGQYGSAIVPAQDQGAAHRRLNAGDAGKEATVCRPGFPLTNWLDDGVGAAEPFTAHEMLA